MIWFLKLYQDGKYCTLPHVIEFVNQPYKSVFTILSSYSELENYLSAFTDALQGGAQDQLQGQIASLKIPLSRLVSQNLYWVMSGNDFTLDLNNPESPKVLCIGSSPQRQQLYSGAIGLYMSRIMKLINKKGQNKMSLIIDELPTVYLNGLDHFIATARSNKISTTLSLQDYSQLVRDYGEKQSKVIFNSLGNIISGQVLGETAKLLSERFGRIIQKRQGYTNSDSHFSSSVSTQLDMLIPSAKISQLGQGYFVGCLSQSNAKDLNQVVFNAKLLVNRSKKVASEPLNLPFVRNKPAYKGAMPLDYYVQKNYTYIKNQIQFLVKVELQRIAQQPIV
ncbi:TraM recognition domain-containing protein [Myroides sp. LJL116]